MTRVPTPSYWFFAATVLAACGGASDFESQNGTPPSAGSTGTAGRATSGGSGGEGATGGSLATGGTGTGGSSKGGTGSGGTSSSGGSSGNGTGGKGSAGTGTGGSNATGGSSGSGAAGRGTGGSGGSGGSPGGMGGVGGKSSCPDTLPPNDAACSGSMACFYDQRSGCLCETSSCLMVKPCRSSDAEDRALPLAGRPGAAGGSGIVAPAPMAITCVCDGESWSCVGIAK